MLLSDLNVDNDEADMTPYEVYCLFSLVVTFMSNKTNEQKFELLKKVMNPMLLLGGGPRGFTPLGPVPTEMMDDVSSIRDEYRTALIIYEVAMGCLLNPQKEIANAGYHLHRIAIGETFKSSAIRHVIHDLQYHALDIPKYK